MKKTALQLLLEELNEKKFLELCSNHKYIKDYLEIRINSNFLKIEKQNIIDAHKDGFLSSDKNEDYFTKKYN